jgi:tetratricopeptide (TPR) repeat protein
MKRFLLCVLLGMLASTVSLTAQDRNPDLDRLSLLSRQGQLPQLIEAANSAIAHGHLTDVDHGIALTYLAYGYHQTGKVQQAIACYQSALDIINRDGLHTGDYATVLAALATIYAETGQVDTARHVLLHSIHLFQNQKDHGSTALIWNDLATLAADEHSSRDAHKYLAHALAESQIATSFPTDQQAAIASTQARIAQLDYDPAAAIAGYQHSLALWKQSHDEQQPQTAWLYILLGTAYLQSGDLDNARQTTLRGLHLLELASGRQSPRFFSAELAYSKVLAASGNSTEAASFRHDAQSGLAATTRPAQDKISIAALR